MPAQRPPNMGLCLSQTSMYETLPLYSLYLVCNNCPNNKCSNRSNNSNAMIMYVNILRICMYAWRTYLFLTCLSTFLRVCVATFTVLSLQRWPLCAGTRTSHVHCMHDMHYKTTQDKEYTRSCMLNIVTQSVVTEFFQNIHYDISMNRFEQMA